MAGAWKFILIVSLWALCNPTWAQGSDHVQSLEAEFITLTQQVQSQLLDAPEASYLYLEHWIKVYNRSASREVSSALAVPKRAPDIDALRIDSYAPKGAGSTWRPNGFPIVSPQWGGSTPFSLSTPAQFRPPPPPSSDSQAYKQALRDVMIMGDLHSAARTPEQSLTVAFWANGTGTETPPGRWNLIALESTRNMPEVKRLEIMLMLNIALYDAGIAAWESKYHYNYWRPQTAITASDPKLADWEPMMQPPFHPEYVSGHSAFSGAAGLILEHYIGPQNFCITAAELVGLTQCYESFVEATHEAGRSRVYGGIHFEFSNQAGLELGKAVANHAIGTVKLDLN